MYPHLSQKSPDESAVIVAGAVMMSTVGWYRLRNSRWLWLSWAMPSRRHCDHRTEEAASRVLTLVMEKYPGAAEFARHGHSMAISNGNDRLQPTACHKPEFVNGLNSRSHKERYHRERRTHQEQRIDGLPTSLNIIYNWLWYVIVYIIQSLFASKVIWHQICSGVVMVVADGLAFNIPLSWCHAA